MTQLIECVPNFSEGRRPEIVAQIVAAIASAGAVIFDQHSDANHNRSVVTFVGNAAIVEEAAFRGCAKAAELIDLDVQRGAHPRMGATDVIPFIPISSATRLDCIAIAKRLGERVGRELGIPVYLYADAATSERNRNLADVRRGEYEGIRAQIETNPARAPDYGPRTLGKAGAVAIGARFALIAFNVNLDTADVRIAKSIAKAVRYSSGGLPFVKALGIELADRGIVQVSMNLTDYRETSIWRAFEAVQQEAVRRGVKVVESEIVGLVPQDALFATAAHDLQLARFTREQVLEVRLADAMESAKSQITSGRTPEQANPKTQTVDATWLDQLAAATPAPGGGSATAQAGAMAAALLMMYTGLTLAKKSYAPVHAEMQNVHDEATQLKDALSAAVAEDAAAYGAVMEAYKLPKESPERAAAIQRAMQGAAEVQMRIAEQATRVLELARTTMEKGLKTAHCDATVATYLAEAAIKGAVLNVRENLEHLGNAEVVHTYHARVSAIVSTIA